MTEPAPVSVRIRNGEVIHVKRWPESRRTACGLMLPHERYEIVPVPATCKRCLAITRITDPTNPTQTKVSI